MVVAIETEVLAMLVVRVMMLVAMLPYVDVVNVKVVARLLLCYLRWLLCWFVG